MEDNYSSQLSISNNKIIEIASRRILELSSISIPVGTISPGHQTVNVTDLTLVDRKSDNSPNLKCIIDCETVLIKIVVDDYSSRIKQSYREHHLNCLLFRLERVKLNLDIDPEVAVERLLLKTKPVWLSINPVSSFCESAYEHNQSVIKTQHEFNHCITLFERAKKSHEKTMIEEYALIDSQKRRLNLAAQELDLKTKELEAQLIKYNDEHTKIEVSKNELVALKANITHQINVAAKDMADKMLSSLISDNEAELSQIESKISDAHKRYKQCKKKMGSFITFKD